MLKYTKRTIQTIKRSNKSSLGYQQIKLIYDLIIHTTRLNFTPLLPYITEIIPSCSVHFDSCFVLFVLLGNNREIHSIGWFFKSENIELQQEIPKNTSILNWEGTSSYNMGNTGGNLRRKTKSGSKKRIDWWSHKKIFINYNKSFFCHLWVTLTHNKSKITLSSVFANNNSDITPTFTSTFLKGFYFLTPHYPYLYQVNLICNNKLLERRKYKQQQ